MAAVDAWDLYAERIETLQPSLDTIRKWIQEAPSSMATTTVAQSTPGKATTRVLKRRKKTLLG